MTTFDQTNTAILDGFQTGSVLSQDGTQIGYYQIGQGPGLVLVQGAMGSSRNFTQLALALSGEFTIYLPDRRGRGLSPCSYDSSYSTQKDVEDLDALLSTSGASQVFGLSSGAIVALQAALTLPSIRKTAIYEPPLLLSGLPVDLLVRYRREIAQGNIAAALISGMLAAQFAPPAFNHVPRALLEWGTKVMLSREAKNGSGDYLPMRELAYALQYDFHIVQEISPKYQAFHEIHSDILLLGGSKSPAYLKSALDALEPILPHARRIEIPGVGHGAAWNADRTGHPEIVASYLRTYFSGG